jgi:serine/threonine-protein kinase TNNI3K
MAKVVAKLKEEVEKQRDLKETYMARLESTQAYLRFCLEVAQVHGFLHLVSNSNGGDDEPHRDAGDQEPATAAAAADDDEDAAEAPPCDPYFAATRDLAVQHGWSVAPDEVRSRETFVHRSQQSLISCPWTQIELHEMIGRGSTADVYRATWRGLDVAVKWMRAEFFAAADQRSRGEAFFAQELDALSRQRHPHVLRLMAACLRPPASCFLVTELLTGATLAQWLHGGDGGGRSRERRRQPSSPPPPPPLMDRVSRALEIALAMRYLHEQTPAVVHRDLKPSNVLLDGDSRVRVADFGHARFLPDGTAALTGETGTTPILPRACSSY